MQLPMASQTWPPLSLHVAPIAAGVVPQQPALQVLVTHIDPCDGQSAGTLHCIAPPEHIAVPVVASVPLVPLGPVPIAADPPVPLGPAPIAADPPVLPPSLYFPSPSTRSHPVAATALAATM